MSATEDLPQFERPPVMEIVGAAQFVGLPAFGLPEIVKVGEALDGYELRELQPQLPPLQESDPGLPEAFQMPQIMFGPPQQRALYFAASDDERFVAQLQRDRIAINERRIPADSGDDPSSEHVWPALEALSDVVHDTLVEPGATGIEYGPRRATFVELTYVNAIKPVEGIWQTHADLHRVLRILSGTAGEAPWAKVERAAVRFSFPLFAADRFCGRLHVNAEPAYAEGGTPMLNLNLITRRRVEQSESLAHVFHACHCEAVGAFASVTTEKMHEHWGRKQ
jgi:hypothetical protein